MKTSASLSRIPHSAFRIPHSILALLLALTLPLAAQTKKPASPAPKASQPAKASTEVSNTTTATLAWDANAPADNVTAYKVYERAPGGATTLLGTTSATTLTFTTAELAAGAHTFVVTAMNERGESEPSLPVSTPAAASPPGNVRITINIEINP